MYDIIRKDGAPRFDFPGQRNCLIAILELEPRSFHKINSTSPAKPLRLDLTGGKGLEKPISFLQMVA
jgi:hypothetical protein